MQLVAEIERALAELAKSGPLEVHENGRRLPGLTENLSYEVRPQGAAPLLHLWSEEQSMVRRVVKIAEQSDEHIGFEVQRFGRSRPDLLEIRVAGRERPAGRLRRESFGERLREILSNQFADESVESFTTSSRLEHSLSGCHARGVMRHGSEAWAVLGVSIEESAATLDTSLTAGLLWLAQARRRASGPPISGLRMFVPAGAAAAAARRGKALDARVRVELYELSETRGTVRRYDGAGGGNWATHLVPRREAEAILSAAAADIAPIVALAPQAILASAAPAKSQRGAAISRPGICAMGCEWRGLRAGIAARSIDGREPAAPCGAGAATRRASPSEGARHKTRRVSGAAGALAGDAGGGGSHARGPAH